MQMRKLGQTVGNVVYVPTALAYTWVFLGWVQAGFILYFAFMVAAIKMDLFRHLSKWPIVSKAALISSPLLVSLGLYFSTLETGYFMLIPLGIYGLLAIFGYRAIAARFDTDS